MIFTSNVSYFDLFQADTTEILCVEPSTHKDYEYTLQGGQDQNEPSVLPSIVTSSTTLEHQNDTHLHKEHPGRNRNSDRRFPPPHNKKYSPRKHLSAFKNSPDREGQSYLSNHSAHSTPTKRLQYNEESDSCSNETYPVSQPLNNQHNSGSPSFTSHVTDLCQRNLVLQGFNNSKRVTAGRGAKPLWQPEQELQPGPWAKPRTPLGSFSDEFPSL